MPFVSRRKKNNDPIDTNPLQSIIPSQSTTNNTNSFKEQTPIQSKMFDQVGVEYESRRRKHGNNNQLKNQSLGKDEYNSQNYFQMNSNYGSNGPVFSPRKNPDLFPLNNIYGSNGPVISPSPRRKNFDAFPINSNSNKFTIQPELNPSSIFGIDESRRGRKKDESNK